MNNFFLCSKERSHFFREWWGKEREVIQELGVSTRFDRIIKRWECTKSTQDQVWVDPQCDKDPPYLPTSTSDGGTQAKGNKSCLIFAPSVQIDHNRSTITVNKRKQIHKKTI